MKVHGYLKTTTIIQKRGFYNHRDSWHICHQCLIGERLNNWTITSGLNNGAVELCCNSSISPGWEGYYVRGKKNKMGSPPKTTPI